MVSLTSYQKDEKWNKAKQLLATGLTWIEVVSYYRLLGGTKVKVYSILDREKLLIIDMTGDKNVALKDANGEVIYANYLDVKNSRKIFEYR